MENTIYQEILKSVKEFPNGLAVYYQGKRISFRGLSKLIDRTADILVNR